MKNNIHPKYEKTTIECACGNKIETRSTVFPSMKVELCSACHPFYTGKQKFVDTAGRVDKFKARMEAAQKTKSQKQKTQKSETEKSNKDKLTEIKKEISASHKDASNSAKQSLSASGGLGKPFEVGQIETSDEELAAADEIKNESGKHKKESNSASSEASLDKN